MGLFFTFTLSKFTASLCVVNGAAHAVSFSLRSEERKNATDSFSPVSKRFMGVRVINPISMCVLCMCGTILCVSARRHLHCNYVLLNADHRYGDLKIKLSFFRLQYECAQSQRGQSPDPVSGFVV